MRRMFCCHVSIGERTEKLTTRRVRPIPAAIRVCVGRAPAKRSGEVRVLLVTLPEFQSEFANELERIAAALSHRGPNPTGLADVVVDDQGDFEIVGIALGHDEAVEMARSLRPDFVLVDLRRWLPDGPGSLYGLEVIESLRRASASRVAVLTTGKNEARLLEMLCAEVLASVTVDEALDSMRRSADPLSA